MTPAELKRYIADYADGEVDPAVQDAVAQHVAESPDGQAEVRRWQGLRRSAQRAVMSEPVPAGLRERVRGALREADGVATTSTRPRVYRLGLSGLAAAAVVIFALAIWPPSVSATAGIDGEYFEKKHLVGAIREHRDALGVRGGTSWEEFNRLRKSGDVAKIAQNASFYCAIPKADGLGYCLQGASEYTQGDNTHILHAYYRCLDRGGNVVSLFVVDREIDVKCKQHVGDDCYRLGEREYHMAQTDRISMVRWTQGGRTYVLCCGLASSRQLAELANGMEMIHPAAQPAGR